MSTKSALVWFAQHKPETRAWLREWHAIPNVGTDPVFNEDVALAAQWAADQDLHSIQWGG